MLVFAVRGKKKHGGIYTPQKGFYDYHTMQPVWVAEMAGDCLLGEDDGVQVGSKAYIFDIFELEPIPLPKDVLEGYVQCSEFADAADEIYAESQEYDGVIEANVIHENSLIGVEETAWKGPNSSLVSPKSMSLP